MKLCSSMGQAGLLAWCSKVVCMYGLAWGMDMAVGSYMGVQDYRQVCLGQAWCACKEKSSKAEVCSSGLGVLI